MNIVHVIATASAAGAEILAKNLVTSFREKGHYASLWIMTRVRDLPGCTPTAEQYETQFVAELEAKGVIVRFMDKLPKGGQIAVWSTLRRAFEADKPDVIHSHLESVSLHVALGLMGKKVRLVQTLHNVRVLFPLLFRTVFNARYNEFVAISEKVGAELRRAGIPSRKINRIYNGIAPFEVDATASPRAWPPKRCIAVGRLSHQKNHALLLDAFAQLRDHLPEDQLPTVDVYGDGPLRDELSARIQDLSIERWIKLRGVHKDIPSLLASYDLYLMTSSWEGLSLSLIEALYAGIPVLATQAGSNDEIITEGETGWLVSTEDVNSFASLWKLLQQNKTALHEQKNTRSKMRALFHFDTCSDEHLSLYKKMLTQ